MTQSRSSTVLEPGTILLEYRIEKVLGAGTFGVVYKAANRFLDEIVAIKEYFPKDLAYRSDDFQVLPKSSDTESAFHWALSRFLKEARILWDLSRPIPFPSIIQVKGYREHNGTAYMIMEYAEGQPLSDMIRDQRTLSPEQIDRIVDPLLDGLETVHNASVLHRDIKPSNILIRPDGSPVLIDFGAAKPDIGKSTARSTIAVYTPRYAPPEQLVPEGRLGAWTDIYSLGATLYYAVTGEPPPNPVARIQGCEYIRAVDAASGRYPGNLLHAIDAAIEPIHTVRPQSISALRKLIHPPAGENLDATIPVHSATAYVSTGEADAMLAANGRGALTQRGFPAKRGLVYGGVALMIVAALFGIQNYMKGLPTESPLIEPRTIGTPIESIAAQIDRRLAQFDCALLESRLTDDHLLEISGHIANPELLRNLEESLAEVPQITEIKTDVETDLDPFCEVIRLYRQYRAENNNAVSLEFNHPDRVYDNRDILFIHAISNSEPRGYLYVDFFDREGNVVHMLPTPLKTNNFIDYREGIVLGEQRRVESHERKRSYEILPPFGTHVVAALFSESPLYSGLRPEFEGSEEYLDVMERILKDIPFERRPSVGFETIRTRDKIQNP